MERVVPGFCAFLRRWPDLPKLGVSRRAVSPLLLSLVEFCVSRDALPAWISVASEADFRLLAFLRPLLLRLFGPKLLVPAPLM